jgi:hypothetical protein
MALAGIAVAAILAELPPAEKIPANYIFARELWVAPLSPRNVKAVKRC